MARLLIYKQAGLWIFGLMAAWTLFEQHHHARLCLVLSTNLVTSSLKTSPCLVPAGSYPLGGILRCQGRVIRYILVACCIKRSPSGRLSVGLRRLVHFVPPAVEDEEVRSGGLDLNALNSCGRQKTLLRFEVASLLWEPVSLSSSAHMSDM